MPLASGSFVTGKCWFIMCKCCCRENLCGLKKKASNSLYKMLVNRPCQETGEIIKNFDEVVEEAASLVYGANVVLLV